MKQLKSKAPVQKDKLQVKLSTTCVACRARHLKCTGETPSCVRCAEQGISCLFELSRQGQKNPPPRTPTPTSIPPALSTTCVNCRERHLKCSGGPSCSRCNRQGVPCMFQRSRRGKRRPRIASLPPTALSLELPNDSKSLRSYTYFQRRTSPDLCGHNDRAFWNILVLQVSHCQPAIMHILTALGSLHESLEIAYSTWSNEEAQSIYLFSLKEHHDAVKLLKNDRQMSIEVVLISCVLLVCFETLQNDYKSALRMFRSGFDIFTHWEKSACNSRNAVREGVTQAFSRLSMQASTFLETAASKPTPFSEVGYSGRSFVPAIDMPSAFTSLDEASAFMDDFIQYCYSIMDPIIFTPDYRLTSKLLTGFLRILDLWWTRLNDLLSRHRPCDTRSQKQALYLKLQYHVAYIMAPRPFTYGDSELRFDKFVKEFAIINTLAAEWLDLDKEDGDDPGAPSSMEVSYNFDMGILSSLFLCGLRCRCPQVRRQVVNLMFQKNFRENSWDSFTAARIVDAVIAVELHGLGNPRTCEEVPASSRIRIVKIGTAGGTAWPGDHVGAGDRSVAMVREELRSREIMVTQAQRVLLRYVREPWDLTSPVEEIWVNI